MSLISELGPITGANTRSEDLFVIVNLIQGDDGTKNITRKELVQALQYEIFNNIKITGGTISNVIMSVSTLNDVVINDSEINNGTMAGTALDSVSIEASTANNIVVTSSVITGSEFNDGTGNNVVLTNSTIDDSTILNSSANNMAIDQSDFSNGTGNNNIFTNSQVDNSSFANVAIEQGTANGLILTNITIDEIVLEDALMSNSVIITTDFSNGTIRDTAVSNVTIVDTDISNSDIRDTDLDNVTITNSRFANGLIWDTTTSNSSIIDSTANNIVITNSVLNDSTANNVQITNSDFSDGTGNNNVFTNTTIQDGILANNVITNSSFQGTLDNVTAQNMTITSSSTDGLVQNKSKIVDAVIEDSAVSNSTITESELVDFDMNLTKEFEPMLDEDSYFALKNVKTGETEKMTYRQLYDEFSRKTEKSLKVHVASDGNDAYDGTILKPVRTLKRAEQLALEKAGGSYDRNDINNAVHISVGPGTYYVDEPVMLPDDTSMTSTGGQYATLIQKKKGWEKTNGILVGSGCYVQGFSYMNFEVDNFDQPTGGFAIAYRPGALLRRSPYLRDSTQLSNFNRLDVEPPLNPFNSKGTILDLGQEFYLVAGHSAQNLFEIDDEVTFSSGATGFVSYIADIDANRQIYVRNLQGNVEVGDILYAQRGGQGTIESIGIDDFPNRLVGRGGGCLLADRAVLDTDSLYTYVLCFGFTPRTQNGTGYVAKNGAGVNGIGSLSIFTRQAFFALDGGQMTLNNSGSQFGDISMRARGSTVIIRPAEANQANLISNTAFADVLVEKSDEIIDDMVYYLTSNTASGGLGYQGYNADKCFRDTGIIVDNTGYDIATDGNYWGRLNGISYRSPISYLVVNEQLTETAGSINHLKDSIASVNGGIFANATTELTDRINTSLNETLNILQNGEAAAEPIIFAETGTAGQAAREVVQSNRDLIINDFVSWIDNNDEFYAYDSAKCERDVQEYILPAVKYDMMLDTNYNTENAGLAYYVNTARTSLENQRNETVASFKRLRKTTDELIQANSAPAATSAYSAFNNVIDTIAGSGDKYTPTKATYDPTTGMMVITIGAHDLTVGRYVNLAEESFTFTCSSDNFKTKISHPRKSEKAYLAALPIVAASAKTITVNPGLTAANFEHRFVEASDNAVSVIGQLLTYSDNAGISVDKRNARKQLQANKEYIQDYMMQWAEDEWYFYDSKKCHRDTEEYILPAVQRDLILGTNYNAIQTGAAYRTKSGEVSVTEQLEQTVGSIDYLKARAATFIGGDSIAVDRTNASFDEMSRLLNNNGKKYTPTNAVYDPAIGSVVMTIGSNDFNIGDEIYIEPHSLVFTCALDGNATKHAYPANQFLNFTPTNATYDVATGEFSATIGTHALKVGDKVEFKPSSIVFNCALDGYITNHPAPESHHPFYKKQITIEKVDATKIYMNVGGIVDGGGLHTFVSASDNCIQAEKIHPAYKKPVTISARTSTTITVNVGESSDTSVHTFVSATNNAIREAGMWTGKFTPQAATYSPVTGELEITIGQHDLPVGKWIQIAPESMVFSCDVGGVTGTDLSPLNDHPAYKEPVRVTGTTSDTIIVNVGNAGGHANNHTFVSATEDSIDSNALFFSDSARVIKAFTPETATYDPVSGEMVITITDHGMTTGDHIELQPLSFAFSCAHNGGGTDYSPRIGDKAYQLPLEISATTTNTITVNCGNAGSNTDPHTFVSADEGAVVQVGAKEQGTYASRILQKNKAYLQNEVKEWMENTYFVYDNAKCSRDTGLILDAVARDILTDSTVNAYYVGKGYTIGTVGANAVINDQLTQTVGAITWLKGKIATDVLTDPTAITRSNAAFDTVIDIMSNGIGGAADPIFGDLTVSPDHLAAGKAILTNKAFIQKEIIAWITANYPNFVYNVAACERDMGIFVDLTSWDVRNGSNALSATNSKLYFENAIPVLDDEEIVPTSEAFFFASDLIGQIVRNEVVTPLQIVATQTMVDTATYTPTDVAYDHNSGVMTMTLGAHTFAEKDYVIFAENAITLSCPTSPSDPTPINISHPRPTDPIFNKPVRIDSVTATTVTLQVGEARVNKVHSFVSALADGIRKSVKPAVAQHAEKLFHDVGDVIRENDGTIPAIVEPAFNTDTANYTLSAEFESIKGQSVKYQTEINEYISEQYNGLAYSLEKCPRDTGYIVDAISEDLEYGGDSATIFNARYYFEGAINVLPQYQREPTRLAFTHLASVMQKVVKNEVQEPIFGARFTPTDATYDPATGIMVATIGTHTLTTADHVWFKPNAITFSCDTGSGPTNHASPEAHHRFYNKACPIIGADATTITLWVGAGGTGQQAHTFVSALADGISEINGNLLYQNVSLQAADTATGTIASDLAMVIANIVDDRLVIPDYRGSLDISQKTPKPLPTENLLTKPKADPARTFARKSLQWNRTFIQEELIQFVRDNNYTFDEAKCARDAGFIIDAVRRDVQTGSTYNGKYIGKSYRIGTVGADKVIEDQLAETIEGIRYVQKDIEAQLSGVALTRAQDSFNNIITSMINDYTPDGTNYNYGVGHISDNHEFAREALQLNREFLKEEATAWVNVNYGGLSYDVNKCKRDTGIMVDAVSYDTQHESNTAMLDVAKLYFENGLSTLSTAQRAPTAALYTHLGAIANQIVLKQTVARSAGNTVVQNTSFGVVTAPIAQHITALWKIVGDLIADDSLINMPDVIEIPTSTAGADGYLYNAEATAIAGRKDNLQGTITQYLRDNFDYLEYDEARCRRDTGYIVDAISHDIQYGGNSAMHGTAELYFKNAVNILPIDQRQSTREAFEYLGKVVRWVTRNEMVPRKEGRKFTPSTATYDPDTGVFTATMANHNLKVGDYVMIAPNSIVFTCSLDGDIALHPSPQAGDPYYNAPMKILARTGTTITMNVGKVPYGKGGGAHTFVSATMNAITHITGNTVRQEMKHRAARRTIADEAMNLAVMLAKVSDDNSPANIPSRIDPDTTWIEAGLITAKNAIDNNSIQMAKDLQIHIGNAYNGISYSKEKCRRDVGVMIDAVSHDVNYTTNYAMIMTAGLYFEGAHSILPADQRQQTAKFFTEMAGVVKSIVQGQTAYQRGFTSTDATYDTDTGYFTATIDAGHGLEIGDYVSFEPASFTFSCDTGSGPTDHAVPEAHHPYYDVPCPILYVEGNVITMFVGKTPTYSGAHTFVSATEGGLKRAVRTWTTQDTSLTAATAVEGEEVADLVRIVEDAIRRDNIDGLPDILEPNTTWVNAGKIEASKIIDDNLDELADDVTKFLKDTFTIIDYSKAKCRRDAGYIIDAMSWDFNYGGNLATRWNADFYYWNNELRIPEDTRVATAKAYRQLGKIVSQVVIGELPGQAIRSELGTTTEEAQAIKLGDILHNVMFYNTPKSLGPIEEPNFEWETSKEFNFAKVILNNNRVKLQREVQRYITSTHKFIDLPKTYRDGGNFIKVLQNDFRGRVIDPDVGTVGSDKASRSFVGALFNIDAQHVFPVFNPPESYADWRKLRFKGTVQNAAARNALTGMKRWDAYIIPTDNNANRYTGIIYVWNGTTWDTVGNNNTDLLDSFTGAWARMKTYINNNIAPDVTHQTMVTELIDNLVINSVIRPDFLTFGSLVESIAHQFNGASAGVNRNALPLNFRNVGSAIGANASVLSEGGGRIRWSGSDELNNQYFARGLKINGRTGRIEGRPFTSSVRKLARRASNSRAAL